MYINIDNTGIHDFVPEQPKCVPRVISDAHSESGVRFSLGRQVFEIIEMAFFAIFDHT